MSSIRFLHSTFTLRAPPSLQLSVHASQGQPLPLPHHAAKILCPCCQVLPDVLEYAFSKVKPGAVLLLSGCLGSIADKATARRRSPSSSWTSSSSSGHRTSLTKSTPRLPLHLLRARRSQVATFPHPRGYCARSPVQALSPPQVIIPVVARVCNLFRQASRRAPCIRGRRLSPVHHHAPPSSSPTTASLRCSIPPPGDKNTTTGCVASPSLPRPPPTIF
jgi:hypothetical protein